MPLAAGRAVSGRPLNKRPATQRILKASDDIAARGHRGVDDCVQLRVELPAVQTRSMTLFSQRA
jgi:hypothetical protein